MKENIIQSIIDAAISSAIALILATVIGLIVMTFYPGFDIVDTIITAIGASIGNFIMIFGMDIFYEDKK